jgi:hypothetical protein
MLIRIPAHNRLPNTRCPMIRAHVAKTFAALMLVMECPMQGCTEPSPVLRQPTYEVRAPTVAAGTLQITVVAINPEDREITYELRQPCEVTIRVYSEGATAPAWDQLQWMNNKPGGCKWLPVPVTLGPGETKPMMATAMVAEILGDSLPAGPYRVSVRISHGAPSPGLTELFAPGTTALLK